MELLMPESVDELKLVDFQKAMKKDLRLAATKLKGQPAWFAVAQDVPLSDKKVTLFVAVRREAEAKAWMLKLKSKKPKVLAIGTCTVDMKDGKSVRVGFDKVKGNRKAILKAARLAMKIVDPKAKFSDPEVEGTENESQEASAQPGSANEASAKESTAPASDKAVAALGLSGDDEAKLAQDLGMTPEELRVKLSENASKIEAGVDKLLADVERELA